MPGASAGPISAPTAPGIPGAAPVQAAPNNGSTYVNPNAAFQAKGSGAGGSNFSTPSGPQALLVSSTASRANTTSNVNSYNSAVASMSTPSATTPVTPSITNPTPNGTQTPASGSGSSTPAGNGGASSNPGGGTSTAPSTANPGSGGNQSGVGMNSVNFSDGTTGQYNSQTNTMIDSNGNQLTWTGTGWSNPAAPGVLLTATNTGPLSSSAPSTSTPSAGSYGVTPAGQNAYSAAVGSGMPTSMAQSYADNIDNLSQEETQAKATLAQAAATVANDPVATAAISAISAKYDTLINAMQAKNTQVLGRASTNVAAFGGLGVMSQTFMSDEMDAASSRIADLNSQRNSAMLAAGTAYAKQDLAAFNTAQTAADKSLTDMNTALNDLNTATDKQVTQTQAATKLAIMQTNAQLSQDKDTAALYAGNIAGQFLASGMDSTSPDFESQIATLAKTMNIDPGILATAVTAELETQKTDAANQAHTADEIQNSDITSKDDQAKTQSQLTTDALTQALDRVKIANGGGTVSGQLNKSIGNATTLMTQNQTVNGMPVFVDAQGNYDANGTFSAGAFKALAANAPSEFNMTRAQFITAFGSRLAIVGGSIPSSYGLSPKETALVLDTNSGTTANPTDQNNQ